MNADGVLKQHWLHVALHFVVDAVVFAVAFVIGTDWVIPDDDMQMRLESYLPGILLGAVVFPCLVYIFSLYSPQSYKQRVTSRAILLAACLLGTMLLMMPLFYFKKSLTIGRGVFGYSIFIAYFAILFHHGLLLRSLRNYRERVAFIMTCTFDELEARFFQSLGTENMELVGLVHYDNYQPIGEMRVLGKVSELADIVRRENVHRILCTSKSIGDPAMCKVFCELRYSGVQVMPLVSIFEEVHQLVPLELITPEWLLSASAQPHMLYIKKVKRAFDIVVSLLGLLFLGPVMVLGMIATKLTSAGPIFYKQVRAGRFGRPFNVIKLRSMRTDAEKHGAVWSSAGKDPRSTPVGHFLRKYRVDEIPQLFNVLRGDMSFVGPRPERPVFIEDLAQQIPYFQERLMVQPGITGWAQVNYPYGSSVEDAKWKLEYDLYYMKHMSLFLDLFILLDTVRIVLRGGMKGDAKDRLPRYEAIWFFRVFNHEETRSSQAAPTTAKTDSARQSAGEAAHSRGG
jgi:sugar transferase (PEP-CTERM system associated)